MQEHSNKRVWLQEKAHQIRRETIRLHGLAPGTRLASSLSAVEILVCLYYGGVVTFDPQRPDWEQRDRVIISKGHGGIALYSILGELGFFDKTLLENIGQKGSIFGSIPDCMIPGFETTNGSLGHGLGVAAGIALGLKAKRNPANVFVLLGDGELYEGSNWEALLFAAHNQLDNLIAILDCNKISMLGYCEKALTLEPLAQKFDAFGWYVQQVDGHHLDDLYPCLQAMKSMTDGRPKMLIAETIKGKGVKKFEGNPLCHILSLSPAEVEQILKEGEV